MTVAIAYHGGSYGTYLEWCLTTLCSDSEIVPPFNPNGNSHLFSGNFRLLADLPVDGVDFFRFHPKTSKDHQLSCNLNSVCEQVNSLIYVYPDPNTKLLCINNYFTKIWHDWWHQHFKEYINPEKIHANWPTDPGVSITDIPLWIKREFLSYYLLPAWEDQVEWYHLDTWHHPKALNITVSQLLFDFENCIKRIVDYTKITIKRPVSCLLAYHSVNLNLQTNINQDSICKNIIDSIKNNTVYHWDPLPLGSEAWVQWQLRNLGWEIECHGLDIFPLDSVHLKKLLYKII